MKCNLCFMYSV